MTEKEYCENCNKLITNKMKDNQQVIYASAEHTLSAPHPGQIIVFNDPMFNGPFCCHECFNEVIGINIEKKLTKEKCINAIDILLKKNDDMILQGKVLLPKGVKIPFINADELKILINKI